MTHSAWMLVRTSSSSFQTQKSWTRRWLSHLHQWCGPISCLSPTQPLGRFIKELRMFTQPKDEVAERKVWKVNEHPAVGVFFWTFAATCVLGGYVTWRLGCTQMKTVHEEKTQNVWLACKRQTRQSVPRRPGTTKQNTTLQRAAM